MAQIDIIPTLEIPPIKIDMERLYNIALDSAHKAAEKEIYEFYTSYGSPFRKKIEEALEKTIPDGNFEIPNLLEKNSRRPCRRIRKKCKQVYCRMLRKSTEKMLDKIAGRTRWFYQVEQSIQDYV